MIEAAPASQEYVEAWAKSCHLSTPSIKMLVTHYIPQRGWWLIDAIILADKLVHGEYSLEELKLFDDTRTEQLKKYQIWNDDLACLVFDDSLYWERYCQLPTRTNIATLEPTILWIMGATASRPLNLSWGNETRLLRLNSGLCLGLSPLTAYDTAACHGYPQYVEKATNYYLSRIREQQLYKYLDDQEVPGERYQLAWPEAQILAEQQALELCGYIDHRTFYKANNSIPKED